MLKRYPEDVCVFVGSRSFLLPMIVGNEQLSFHLYSITNIGRVLPLKILCTLQSFIRSGCMEHLDFLHSLPDMDIFQRFHEKTQITSYKSLTDIPAAVPEKDNVILDEKVPLVVHAVCYVLYFVLCVHDT